MLTLHYAPDNASLVVRLVLEAMALPYRTRLVDRAANAQAGAAYRAINPAGRIPALETPQGPIFETGAIILWLADRHDGPAPRPDAADRGTFLSWLFFTSNTLHADLRLLFYPHEYAAPEARAEHHARTTARLRRHLGLLDTYRARRPDTPTVLDFYLACCLRWCALYPAGGTGWFDLAATPALALMAQRLDDHPATRAAAAAEGLGPTPFSAPRHAKPPEGSAT